MCDIGVQPAFWAVQPWRCMWYRRYSATRIVSFQNKSQMLMNRLHKHQQQSKSSSLATCSAGGQFASGARPNPGGGRMSPGRMASCQIYPDSITAKCTEKRVLMGAVMCYLLDVLCFRQLASAMPSATPVTNSGLVHIGSLEHSKGCTSKSLKPKGP